MATMKLQPRIQEIDLFVHNSSISGKNKARMAEQPPVKTMRGVLPNQSPLLRS